MEIKLSEKEIRYIEMKSEGKQHHQIASELYLSKRYVHKLANELYRKTGTINSSSLVSWAYRVGILKINAEK